MKHRCLCLVVCMASGAMGAVSKTPSQHLIRKPAKPIAVDGKLDEWDMGASPYVISPSGPKEVCRVWTSLGNPLKGDRDLSARAALCWDERYLYVAAQVTDDHLIGVRPTSAGNQGPPGWGCDSLMVAMSSFRQPMKSNCPYHRYVFLSVRYAPTGPKARGQLVKETSRRELDKRDAYWKVTGNTKWAASDTARGYNVEAAVPWRDLGFTARSGEPIFLSFLLADTDPGEALNQLGWRFSESPKDWPVFRLARRADVLGMLTTSTDEVAHGRPWAVRVSLDAVGKPARVDHVRVVDAKGRTVASQPVGLDVPKGMTGVVLVEFDARTLARPGAYTVEQLAGPAGTAATVVARASLGVVKSTGAPPLVQTPLGTLINMPAVRVAQNAFTEHYSKIIRHGFVTGKKDYLPFIRKHLDPYLKDACKYALRGGTRFGYSRAILCVPMYKITGDQEYVRMARRIIDATLEKLDKSIYYFQFQGLTLYRYLTWLKDPASPFAPKDAEKRYRAILHNWAANPPELMFSESGTHNRIWLRYSLLWVSRKAAEEDGKPVDPRVVAYLAHHKPLIEDPGDSDDASQNYHWAFFQFAMPIWFYEGDWKAFLEHKGWQRTLRRYVEMASPSGACPQFGSGNGWHETGKAIWTFELMSRLTRDGRFRWTSHRIAEYVYNHLDHRMRQYHIAYDTVFSNFLLGWLFADDTVKPTPPPAHSRVTWRHPTVSVSLDELRKRPGTSRGRMDASRWVPDKVVLSGSNRAQSFWGMIDLLPRGGHAGETPGNLITLMIHDAALLAGQGYYDLTPEYQNIVWIEDLDGVAADPRPIATDVPIFIDDPAFTFVRIRTQRYQHMPVVYTRDVLFCKQGFAVVKDRVTFQTMMKVRVGPCFQTRCLGPQCGTNWFNTYFDQLYYTGLGQGGGVQSIRNPAWDLLVYFSPRADRRHTVTNQYKENVWRNAPVRVRQTWSGLARPGQQVVFTTVLLPHVPSLAPGEMVDPPRGSKDPKRVEIVVDRNDLTVLKAVAETDPQHKWRHETWVVLNDTGKPAGAGPIKTDGCVAVVGHHHDGRVVHRVVAGGKTLRYRGRDESAKARKPKVGPLAMPKGLTQ